VTDFFDELERELRRAHRRDIERHARSRRFDRRRLPGVPAIGRGALAALAVLVVLVAVVLAVARTWEVERPALSPPPLPRPTAPPAGFGCARSEFWRAPIVDEPIPHEIASRFAAFGDLRAAGELPRDLPAFVQAKKKYRGAVTLRPRLDTGTRLRVVMIAADVTTAPNHDFCAPPPDPTEPGLCVAVDAPGANSAVLSPQQGGRYGEAMCFTVDDIEDADAWFGLTSKTVFGLAPDGVDRVTFDTPAGTKTLSISENVFAGEVRQHSPGRSSRSPADTHVRFAP
jgi:hypothetical protein